MGIEKGHVISTTEARRDLSKYLNEVGEHPWFVFKNATPRAVILDIDDYEALQGLLDHVLLAKELEARKTAPGEEEEIDPSTL